MAIKNVIKALQTTDFYHLFILTFYSTCAVIFFNKLDNSLFLISSNSFISIAIISAAIVSYKLPNNRKIILFNRILMAPLVYFIYLQVHKYIPLANPNDYDNILIELDRAIFGVDPTHWISKISFPALTEYLQISYMTYFILPLVLGIEMHFTKNDKEFNNIAGTVILSFYISYLLYFLIPAIGPRFTLHNFYMLSEELPGLWITDTLRNIVNHGGGIIQGDMNAAMTVHRDCMPSGHTMTTFVNLVLAFKYRSKFKWVIFIFTLSLIFSTVYLRYHYVVDILAGLLCGIFVLWAAPKLNKFIYQTRN
jgi:membrane-associated phospholipid phosphatase